MLMIEKLYPNSATAKHALVWYRHIGSHVPVLYAHEKSIIKYEFIEGTECRDPDKIWQLAKKIIWTHPRKEMLELRKYRSYVLSCSMDYEVSRSLLELDRADLTTCDNVHGHLTPDHVIENSRGLFFISPGYSYGLRCQELDESWLLYSFGESVPFIVRECHRILLSSIVAMLGYPSPRLETVHHTSFACRYQNSSQAMSI